MGKEVQNRMNQIEVTLCVLFLEQWIGSDKIETQEAYTGTLNKIKEGFLLLWKKTTTLERRLSLAESNETTQVYT